jgi:arylsulfatase A-like enzyme
MVLPGYIGGMKSSHLLPVLLAAAIAAPAASRAADQPAAARPNIIVILADDLGYGDLACYGHPTIRTPHLDRMAREGMRFTDFYSAAEVCTPSRTALLTGRYPIRSGMCHDRFRVLRRVSLGALPDDEITLAEILKGQGYATACIGKWHLGVWTNNPAGHPKRHGFEAFFGLPHSNDMNPAAGLPKGAPARLDQDPAWWQAPLFRNEELLEQPADQTTLTRRYTEEAVRFIREHKAGPFFLYFPHTFPHVPLFASKEFRGKSPRGLYGDVVEELDASIGQLLDAVREAGIEKNTFVFFTSDNGPWLTQGLAGGSAGLLREGKGSTWEGGMRVPGIAWRPGTVPAGSTCREIASTMDLFVTAAKWAGGKVPDDRPIDGYDITPLLTAAGTVDRGVYLYFRGTKLFAARLGKWKAHFWTQPAYGTPEPTQHNPPLLFDLHADPGETFNVAAQHADVLSQIQIAVDRQRQALDPAPTQLEAAVAP